MTPTFDREALAADRINRIDRRNVLAGIAGVGLAGVGVTRVFAQDSTPTAEETPAVGAGDESTPTSTTSTKYDTFVANLAAELGSDSTTVDTAIRDSLKLMVDDSLAAGDITEDEATERKTKIDESTSPIRFSSGMNRGGGNPGDGSGGDKGGDHSGGQGGPDTSTDETPEVDASPTI